MAARAKSQTAKDGQDKGYTVLARRYRSRTFDELIGQEPIALTLQNAIKTNRTAHAYLFCGTRGVGKTSMARIFARALNATDDLKEKDQIADAILRGDDLDVIEIDGASNRGVNEARDLIAGAGLSPTRSRYKIYIIDEVHMLTREAFNALLKTMEEPPSHVKFILCTTEPHKVPATIQSRCQRFDFRPIPSSKIAEQIKRILKDEGISADDEVIGQVARLGNGSMRDALSLLDRLLAGGDRKLTGELIEQMLGLPDHALITGLVDAFIASDAAAALQRGAELLATGATVEQALELLCEHLRNLMVAAACGEESAILDLSDENRKTVQAQAAHFDAAGLVHMIAICDAVARSSKNSSAARALFDSAMVRLAMSQRFADIEILLSGKQAPATAPAALPSRAGADPKKKEPLVEIEIAATSEPTQPTRQVAETKPASGLIGSEAPSGQISDADIWPRVLEVAQASVPDRQRTEHLVFESFDGRTLKLSLDESGADVVRYLTTNTDKIADLVKRATGRTVRIELDTSRFEAAARVAPADSLSVPKPAIVQKAMDLFGAEIIAVDDAPSNG